jgi:hypothetical protein
LVPVTTISSSVESARAAEATITTAMQSVDETRQRSVN